MIVLASVCRIDATKRHPQAGAYGLGVLTVTHAILVEQDFADIFLPAAKLCNYIAAGTSARERTFQTVADILFAAFAVAWIPTRHGVLPMIYYSIVTEAEDGLAAGGCNCGDGSALVYNPDMNCTSSNKYSARCLTCTLVLCPDHVKSRPGTHCCCMVAKGMITPDSWGTILKVYTVALAIFQVLLLIWLKEIIVAVWTALVTGDLQEAERTSNQVSEELDADKVTKRD